jgi:hypothetical protein
MEKRSRSRVPELVTRLAFQGLSENEIGRARISMMARNANVPFKGRIQKRKTYHLQIITFGLQRAAGPYSWVIRDRVEPAAGPAMSAMPRLCCKTLVETTDQSQHPASCVSCELGLIAL